MIGLIQNEYIKLFHQKKIYFLLLTMLALTLLGVIAYGDLRVEIINNTLKGQRIVGENRQLIANLDYINFAKLITQDFLFKPFFPIYLIFLSIIATSVYSEDLLSGNIKFSLLSRLSRSTILMSKIAFTLSLVFFIALINLFMNLLVGYIAFGGSSFSTPGILSTINIYLLSVPPAGAFSLMVLLLSAIFKNSLITMVSSMLLAVLINIMDLLSSSKFFSPIGYLAILGKDNTSSITISPLFPEIGYIIIFSFLFVFTLKKSDIVF